MTKNTEATPAEALSERKAKLAAYFAFAEELGKTNILQTSNDHATAFEFAWKSRGEYERTRPTPPAPSPEQPKNCNVVCAAASVDGVVCPDDNCDYATGVRTAPTRPTPQPDAVVGEAYITNRVLPDESLIALTIGNAHPEDYGMVKVDSQARPAMTQEKREGLMEVVIGAMQHQFAGKLMSRDGMAQIVRVCFAALEKEMGA